MKTWIILAAMAAAFSGLGVLLAVIALATGEWIMLAGLIFLAVGLVMAAFVPATRREQDASGAEPPAEVAGVVPFERVAELIRERLAGSPYSVALQGSRILVHADLADAEFLGWASAHKVKVVRGLEVVAKEPGVAITRDFEQDFELSLGVGRVTGSARVQSGRSRSFERRIEYGVGPDMKVGRQVDVCFSSKEIQEPVDAVLTETGWKAGFWSALPAEGKVGVIMAAVAGAGAVVTVVVLLIGAALGGFS
ncbi:MAG: hypothetical protein JWN68_3555 [Nocardioides sp.]|jgi:hypothetical protein|uniref:hypothetical protein n=1 Tax=Nocardioides sp. TaxID=35761 RepID=UPI00262A18D3|nr:hypothetical protein [Nocardioides sp.]MCW2835602.1 hypothetical protein [Nocardioides sp.]